MSTNDLAIERRGKIGSSDIAALFGESPWLTEMQLYAHHHSGMPLDGPDDERMAWGRALQDAIAAEYSRRSGAWVQPNPGNRWMEYRDKSLRTGATIDATLLVHDKGIGALEIKNVGIDQWHKNWSDDIAPAHIELQLQHQMMCLGAKHGTILALVGGNELHVYEREASEEVHSAIRDRLRDFWRRVTEGDPPPMLCPQDDEMRALLWAGYIPMPESFENREADAEFSQLVADYDYVRGQRLTYEKSEKDLKPKLARAMGTLEGALSSHHRVTATLVSAAIRDRTMSEETEDGLVSNLVTALAWAQKVEDGDASYDAAFNEIAECVNDALATIHEWQASTATVREYVRLTIKERQEPYVAPVDDDAATALAGG